MTHVAFVAVVGRLILHTTLVADLFPCSHQLLPQDLDVFDGLHQTVSNRKPGTQTVKSCFCLSKVTIPKCPRATHLNMAVLRFTPFDRPTLAGNHILDHLKGVGVADLDCARHIPGHVDHGNN